RSRVVSGAGQAGLEAGPGTAGFRRRRDRSAAAAPHTLHRSALCIGHASRSRPDGGNLSRHGRRPAVRDVDSQKAAHGVRAVGRLNVAFPLHGTFEVPPSLTPFTAFESGPAWSADYSPGMRGSTKTRLRDRLRMRKPAISWMSSTPADSSSGAAI